MGSLLAIATAAYNREDLIMFTLTENDILKDFSCRYEDECGNKLRMARKGAGFYARVKFANENVTLPAVHVNFPLDKSEDGLNVRLNFADDIDHSKDADVLTAVSGLSAMISRWIRLIGDVLDYDIARQGGADEETTKEILSSLGQYEELKGIIQSVH